MAQLHEIKSMLIWFHNEMFAKLEENIEKTHWNTSNIRTLIFNLNCEFNELSLAISSRNKDGAIKECADIANFAMMIADKLKNQGFDK